MLEDGWGSLRQIDFVGGICGNCDGCFLLRSNVKFVVRHMEMTLAAGNVRQLAFLPNLRFVET